MSTAREVLHASRPVPATPRGLGARGLGAVTVLAAMAALAMTGGPAWSQSLPVLPTATTSAPTAVTAGAPAAVTASAPTAVPTTIRAPRPKVPASLPPGTGPRPGHVRLEYKLGKGSASCDSEALFRKILAMEMGEPDPFVPAGPAERIVVVSFDNDAPGFRGVVELRDMEGAVLLRREGIERTCADASDRAMVVLMQKVFPLSRPSPPAPLPAPPPDVPPVGLRGVTADDFDRFQRAVGARLDAQDETIEELRERNKALQRALDEERRKMDLTFALSAGALITANLTSNVGPGVWIGGEARTGPISLGLEVRGVLPSPVFVGPYDLDVSQIVALIVPCGRYSYFFGCVVAGPGAEIHQDSNYSAGGFGGAGPVWQFGGRLGIEVPLGESMFGARAWGEVLHSAPKTGQDYPGNRHWDRPDVSAFFGLGLVLRFGSEGAK